MRLRIQIPPWELLSDISISIVIIYVLALQLVFQARSILFIFTIIALFAAVIQLHSFELGGWYTVFLLLSIVSSIIVTSDFFICTYYLLIVIKTFVFFLAIINCLKLKTGFSAIRYSTIVAGIILSYMLLFRGVATDSMRRSVGEGVNENIVAASITVAIVLTLYDFTIRKKGAKRYIEIAAIVFMCSAALLTGTRKSFIAIIVLLALYLVLIVMPKSVGSSKNQIRKFIIVIIGLVAVLYFIKYGIDQTNIGDRFRNIGYQGDKMRVYYYGQAFRIFCENPLFGTGWGGFVAQIGIYSHSTYGELIANTGIIGSLLFFAQYYFLIQKGIRNIRSMEKSNDERSLTILALVSILIILFLGIGTVIFYEINLTLCIGIAYVIIKRGSTCVKYIN